MRFRRTLKYFAAFWNLNPIKINNENEKESRVHNDVTITYHIITGEKSKTSASLTGPRCTSKLCWTGKSRCTVNAGRTTRVHVTYNIDLYKILLVPLCRIRWERTSNHSSVGLALRVASSTHPLASRLTVRVSYIVPVTSTGVQVLINSDAISTSARQYINTNTK